MQIQPETWADARRVRTVTLFRDLYGEPPIAAKTGGLWYAQIPAGLGPMSGRWAVVAGGYQLDHLVDVGRLVPCGEMLIERC
jgi:hypothetical protein